EDARGRDHFERISASEVRAAWKAGVGNHPLWDEVVSVAPSIRRKRFTKPTLWIYAAALGRPNAAFRAQFEGAFPDLESRELDCGHWIPEERPAELVALLQAFLEA
ncbi:MAG: alpha/beta fold hydrolase, partial [Actinomycetota bacterium]